MLGGVGRELGGPGGRGVGWGRLGAEWAGWELGVGWGRLVAGRELGGAEWAGWELGVGWGRLGTE